MTKQQKISLITGVVVALGLAAWFFFPVSGPGTVDAGGMNLLMITLDTTRADHIGAYGYKHARTPNIDRLAGNGILMENCYSPAPLTLPAHSSLFTGMYPVGHQVRDNGSFFLSDHAVTLAEKMKELPQNYTTFSVVASFVLMSKFGLNQGVDRYDDSLKVGEMISSYDSEISADQVYAKFKRWHEENKEKPFFAWVHFYDPHVPYTPPKRYASMFDDSMQGRYDGELAFTDAYVGHIIQDLEKAGQMENTLIVIVGDHGEAFGEHNEFGHSLFCYQENLRVPLILYNPVLFEKPLRISNRVSLTDIMPTLLDMYHLDIPASVQGESFAKMTVGERPAKERTLYAESMHGKEEMGWAPLTAIIDGNYKYISLPQPELYDLAADPIEKNNLFLKQNYLARNLDDKLMKLVKIYSSVAKSMAEGSQRQLTTADKQHLQSLGYISAFAGKSDSNLDPKAGILLKNEMNRIDRLIDQKQLDEAQAALAQMAQKNPTTLLPQYFGAQVRIYKELKQQDNVLESWHQAIKTFPENDNFKINLAFEFFQMNRYAEADDVAVAILKNNDKYTRAYILRGKIKEKMNRADDALEFYQKAYALEPLNSSLAVSYAKVLARSGDTKKTAELCELILKDANVMDSRVTDAPVADAPVTDTPVADSHGRESSVMNEPEGNLDLKNRLAIVLTEIRQDQAAFQLLTQIEQAGKAGADTLDYLGIHYFRQGNYDAAADAYQRSISKDPNVAMPWNNFGTLYLTQFIKTKDRSFHSKAMDAFNKALQLDPGLASALNGRASAYNFAGRTAEALKDWRKALETKPDFIDVYFNLAITYLQMNNKRDALHFLNRCKELFYLRLPQPARQRLDRLIREAGGTNG